MEQVIHDSQSVATYGYDFSGNRASLLLQNGVRTTCQYNTKNQLTFLENKRLSDNFIISSYQYSLAVTGLRTAVTEHDGRHVAYAYDNLRRLTQEAITDATNGNRTFGYLLDEVGNRLTKTDTDPQAGNTNYTYNANDQLLVETSPQGITQYAYDANGATTSKSAPTEGVSYAWDFDGRLRVARTVSSFVIFLLTWVRRRGMMPA